MQAIVRAAPDTPFVSQNSRKSLSQVPAALTDDSLEAIIAHQRVLKQTPKRSANAKAPPLALVALEEGDPPSPRS